MKMSKNDMQRYLTTALRETELEGLGPDFKFTDFKNQFIPLTKQEQEWVYLNCLLDLDRYAEAVDDDEDKLRKMFKKHYGQYLGNIMAGNAPDGLENGEACAALYEYGYLSGVIEMLEQFMDLLRNSQDSDSRELALKCYQQAYEKFVEDEDKKRRKA